jgi:hypothetical protein
MSLFDNNSKVENLLTVSLSENINTYKPGTRLYSIIILQYIIYVSTLYEHCVQHVFLDAQ